MPLKGIVEVSGPVMGSLHCAVQYFPEFPYYLISPFLKSVRLFHVDIKGVVTVEKSQNKVNLP